MDCIFCKIVKGEADASKVYEDDEILGFMNIKSPHPGECLLIPKQHIDHFTDIPEELAAKIMKIGQKLANNIRKELNPERVGYVVAGYGVPHAHLIIVPQHHINDITSQHFAVLEDGKIKFTDEHIPIADRKDLDKIAERLKI